MMFSFKKFISLILILNLPQTLLAADYCGQPVPHDIAQEGYSKTSKENAFADPGASSTFAAPQNQQMPSLQGQIIYIPPGASIPIYLDRPIGSGITRMGEMAYAHITNGGGFGIPQGTIAELTVLMVEPARHGFARPGRIQIGANRLILPTGQSIWLKGLVVDAQGRSSIKGQATGTRVGRSIGKVALGAGLGAASGAGIAYASGGYAGSGALIGTALGTVIGGIWAAATKGQDVVLPSGMQFYLNVTEGTQAYL